MSIGRRTRKRRRRSDRDRGNKVARLRIVFDPSRTIRELTDAIAPWEDRWSNLWPSRPPSDLD